MSRTEYKLLKVLQEQRILSCVPCAAGIDPKHLATHIVLTVASDDFRTKQCTTSWVQGILLHPLPCKPSASVRCRSAYTASGRRSTSRIGGLRSVSQAKVALRQRLDLKYIGKQPPYLCSRVLPSTLHRRVKDSLSFRVEEPVDAKDSLWPRRPTVPTGHSRQTRLKLSLMRLICICTRHSYVHLNSWDS
jgi:hypothetical protein